MKKSNYRAVFALGLLLLPLLKLQAEDGTSASADIHANIDVTVPPLGSIPPRPSIRKDGPLDGLPPQPGIQFKAEGSTEVEAGHTQGGQGANKGAVKEDVKKFEADTANRKKEILNKIATIKGEVKVKLQANAQEKVKKILEDIFKKLTGQVEKLVNLDARVGAKISALATAGVDVTAMQSGYANAQTLLEKAKVDVTAAGDVSIDQTNTETSKDTLRTLVKTAEDSIKAAGNAYKKVIALMPEDKPTIKVENTTTSSATVAH